MPLVKVMVDQIFFEANENGKPENPESTPSAAEETEAIVRKEVRGLSSAVDTITQQLGKAQAEIMQLRELNDKLLSRLLILEAKEKTRSKKDDEEKALNTADDGTKVIPYSKGTPSSWARVVQKGKDMTKEDQNEKRKPTDPQYKNIL